MFDSQVLVPTDADIAQLDAWRNQFTSGSLETPDGWSGDGVATAVAKTAEGKLIGSLTAAITLGVTLDPLIRNPHAGRMETLAGLFALTRALEYQGQLNGAVASYISVPNSMPDYQTLVQKCGFRQIIDADCKVYRHSFRTA